MKKKKTCVAVEGCNVKNADAHNSRKVKLIGIREDLTNENIFKLKVPADERYRYVKSEYEKTVGQRMQPTAQPIIEIVVVGIENEKQSDDFKEKSENEFGFEVLSFAVHRDEGHYDLKTGDWIPNYHAHFVVDKTIWRHEPITAPKKRHGKIQKDKDGNVVMESKDRYARQIHLGKKELSRLQDIAAEVTGLERGVPSTIRRLRALQYKAAQLQKNIAILTKRQGEIEASIDGLNQERDALEEENEDVEESMKGIYNDLKGIGETIIGALETNKDSIREWGGAEMSLSLSRKKEDLEMWTVIDPEQSHTSIGELVSSFAAVLTAVMLALLAVFEAAMANMRKQLSELKKQVQRQSLMQSAKSALTALLDKPANEQVRQLAAENQALRDANAALEAKNGELGTINKTNQQELLVLRSEVSANKDLDNRYRGLLRERNATVEAKNILASDLIARIQPQEIIRLEYLGFPTLLGAKRWDIIKTKVNLKHAPKVTGGPKIGGPKK